MFKRFSLVFAALLCAVCALAPAAPAAAMGQRPTDSAKQVPRSSWDSITARMTCATTANAGRESDGWTALKADYQEANNAYAGQDKARFDAALYSFNGHMAVLGYNC